MSDIRKQNDLIPGLYLRSTKFPNIKPGALGSRLLSQLALRYAGDDGMTVKGTAQAMAFSEQVHQLKPGGVMRLPKAKEYEIYREAGQ